MIDLITEDIMGTNQEIRIKVMGVGGGGCHIETCQKIQYLRPRSHAVSYVMLAYRIAYYKVHFPSAFYKAYFSVRSIESDADVISAGKEALKKRLEEQEALQGPSFEEASVLVVSERLAVLRVAWEMLLRGFTV